MKIKSLFIMMFLFINVYANQTLKVGVLAFGTVNWELDVIKHNKLDKKYGIDLQVVKLASKNAVSIAIQSKSVDIIVTDWIWVNRQRFEGRDYTFYPYSRAIGALYTSNKDIKTLLDLKGKRLGVSGGSVDKTWLLFQAYTKSKYNQNLKKIVDPVFAAPPILYKKMLDKSLDASINFWHFNAKLKAKEFRKLIDVQEVFNSFDIRNDVPLVGWTFSQEFAMNNKQTVNNFLQASYEAKRLLNSSEFQWDRIRNLMKAKNDNTFNALKEGYRNGIVKEFSEDEKQAASKVFELLYKEGGKSLVGKSTHLDKDTFWDFKPDINW